MSAARDGERVLTKILEEVVSGSGIPILPLSFSEKADSLSVAMLALFIY